MRKQSNDIRTRCIFGISWGECGRVCEFCRRLALVNCKPVLIRAMSQPNESCPSFIDSTTCDCNSSTIRILQAMKMSTAWFVILERKRHCCLRLKFSTIRTRTRFIKQKDKPWTGQQAGEQTRICICEAFGDWSRSDQCSRSCLSVQESAQDRER